MKGQNMSIGHITCLTIKAQCYFGGDIIKLTQMRVLHFSIITVEKVWHAVDALVL